jgi:hypothetical protein
MAENGLKPRHLGPKNTRPHALFPHTLLLAAGEHHSADRRRPRLQQRDAILFEHQTGGGDVLAECGDVLGNARLELG